jgi:hypothetical protein
MRRIASFAVLFTGGVLFTIMPGLVQASAGKSPHVCSGTLKSPGVLKGSYPTGVVVKGVCEVKSGPAHVIGTVTVRSGAALAAASGLDKSTLKITGNLVVDQNGVAVLGCKVNPDGSGFPCIDDPNPNHPTLKSHEVVTGSIIENAPLGVIVHNSLIGGSITQTGGGGGVTCAVPKTGTFAAFKSPVYSDYEDLSVGGSLVIKSLKSCWLGVGRDDVEGSVTIDNNEMADPDAIEVFSNYISKNLACHGNSHPSAGPPGDEPVWDSGEATFGTAIYPRHGQPDTVEGTRSGQCVKATPITQGGSSPGLF